MSTQATTMYRDGCDSNELPWCECSDLDMPHVHCERCQKVWSPRKRNIVMCPHCRSPYWNKPRERGQATTKKKKGR